jgi:hypothetical protein
MSSAGNFSKYKKIHNWESKKCSGNAYLVMGSPDFWERNPRTFGFPVTKFASTLCLNPNYICKGNLALYVDDIKHDSYKLAIFTLV